MRIPQQFLPTDIPENAEIWVQAVSHNKALQWRKVSGVGFLKRLDNYLRFTMPKYCDIYYNVRIEESK